MATEKRHIDNHLMLERLSKIHAKISNYRNSRKETGNLFCQKVLYKRKSTPPESNLAEIVQYDSIFFEYFNGLAHFL